MHISYQQLRAFAAVARNGSFTRAADALHTTQSALSSRIAHLESSFGARLFDRTTRSVRITRTGRDLLPAVERILGDTEALVGHTKDISAGIAGRIVLAALPSISATLLPEAIAAFRRQHPRISIVLKDAVAETTAQMVRGDEVDFAISSPIGGDKQLVFTPLLVDSMAAVFPRDHPLVAVRRMKLERLAGYPLVLTDPSSSVRRLVEEAMRRKGRSLQPAFEVTYMSTAVGMVRAGLGVAILPSISLDVRSATDLEHRDFVDRSLTRQLGIVRRQGRSIAPAVETFVAFLVHKFKQISPQRRTGR